MWLKYDEIPILFTHCLLVNFLNIFIYRTNGILMVFMEKENSIKDIGVGTVKYIKILKKYFCSNKENSLRKKLQVSTVI